MRVVGDVWRRGICPLVCRGAERKPDQYHGHQHKHRVDPLVRVIGIRIRLHLVTPKAFARLRIASAWQAEQAAGQVNSGSHGKGGKGDNFQFEQLDFSLLFAAPKPLAVMPDPTKFACKGQV